jgi:hypothetical protein
VSPTEPPAVVAALVELASVVTPERIDRVWIFSARRVGERESRVVVLSLFVPEEARRERREIHTVRMERTLSGRHLGKPVISVEGVAPEDRVDRVIAGVLTRLKEVAENPMVAEVGGDGERWEALLDSLRAETLVDPGPR